MRDEGKNEPERINKALGRKIRGLRKQTGMNQSQFAKKLHITQQAVSKIENGKSAQNVVQLRDLTEAMGVTTAAFELDELGKLNELGVTGAGKVGAGGSGSVEKVSG